MRLLHDQRVPARDGVTLSADVYLPTVPGTWPVVYQWTPYESTRDRFIAWGVWFAERGYAAVVQDVRGRYESEGRFSAYEDGRDAYDSLDWAVAQPWCSGRVGTWGRSYGAIVQWQVVPLQHPNLTCMAPHVIMDDYFGDCHYIGGAFQLALSVGGSLIWNSTIGVVTYPPAGRLILNPRVLGHLPLIEIDELALGRRVDYWRDWLRHPTYDDYWARYDHRRFFDRVTAPMFQQGGWYDAYAGAHLRTFNEVTRRAATQRARAGQKVLMGPWSHEEEVEHVVGGLDLGPAAARFIRDDELRWYDHWLKDIDTGYLEEPPLTLFRLGANDWRREHEWPLPGTAFTPFYLHSRGRANTLAGNGTLSADAPSAEPADRFDYDPDDPAPTVGGNSSILTMLRYAIEPVIPGPLDQRPLERRDDVLCYTSRPLEKDLEVTGPIEMVLYAATSAVDTDWIVRLSDVHPDGRAIFLAEGIIRARYRSGLDRQDPLEPGEVARYAIRCYPTSNVFFAGHRIRLDVTSSSFPRFSRNLNTGEDVGTGTRRAVARQTVLHSTEYPSHIVLPVVPPPNSTDDRRLGTGRPPARSNSAS
ncbi:MAG TPA: CocE/NonD family hydrolase [Candidatus Dormibacteraeota bacterium]|nr:CocE/NonD family hydrolase [Candidatus Dormibacteraeota bacterium]